MRRSLLICVIVSLCFLVALAGNLTMTTGKGVLVQHGLGSVENKGYLIFVDIEDKRVFLLKGDEILKDYPAVVGDVATPSPEGNWIAIKRINKNKKTGRKQKWLQLDVPWGNYSLHGTDFDNKIRFDAGSIRLFNDDMDELFYLIEGKAAVSIKGQESGSSRELMVLTPGNRGAEVYEVEKRMRTLGYNVGKIDGIYDEELLKAINKYQREHLIKVSSVIDYQLYRRLGLLVLE